MPAAAFGITHGDIMFDDLSYYPRYNRIVGTIGLPWFNCCGNHDMNLEAPDNVPRGETFKRVFGARWLAFQHGEATFFLLDNVDYLGTDPAKPNGSGKYRGYFGERQLGFMRNVLANVPRDSLVVISFHIPLKTLAAADPRTTRPMRGFPCGNRHAPEQRQFLRAHAHERALVFHRIGRICGRHAPSPCAGRGIGKLVDGPFDARGIPLALQSDGCPNGFHVLSVDGAQYTTTLVPAHDPARGQMRLSLDSQVHGNDREVLRDYHAGALLSGSVAAKRLGSTRLVLNLFDGGPRSQVEVSLAGGPALAMQRVERTDPFVVEGLCAQCRHQEAVGRGREIEPYMASDAAGDPAAGHASGDGARDR